MQGKLPIIIAVLFGIIAFVGIGKYLRDKAQPPPTRDVLVAAVNKSRGQLINRSDIRIQQYPADLLQGMTGFYTPGNETLLAGRTLTQDIGVNNVILEGHLRREMENTSAEAQFTSNLQIGQRAISIPLDSEGMVSSFVRPGDRVDILANLDLPEVVEDVIQVPNAMPQVITREVSRPTTAFLFQNVKVLAVGDEYLQPNITAEDTGRGRNAKSVTMAVTPEEAQVLSFAMRYGNRAAMGSQSLTFTLLLRRADDTSTLDDLRLVGYDDFKQLGELGNLQLERNVRNSQERSSGVDAILGSQNTP
jgi:Flp pilus assembly protein CpaB